MARRIAVQYGDGARASVRAALGPRAGPEVTALARRAVLATLRAEGVRDAELSVSLLGDAEIAALNERYLSHDVPTDVLSFPLYEAGESPVGDICIGVDQAVRQAASLGVQVDEELVRLAVHGTLHVLGHVHPEGDARVRSEMWRRQERVVAEVMAS